MNALQTTYTTAKAAWIIAEAAVLSLPTYDMNDETVDWAAVEIEEERVATEVGYSDKWLALLTAEDALLTWGKATSIRLAKTDEEKAAVETVFNSATGRKMVINSLLKLEA